MNAKTTLAPAATVALALSGCGGRGGNDAGGSNGCDPGITDDSIKIGTSLPMSGGAAPYAAIGKAGQAYFEQLNEQGGVKMGDGKTRKVEMILKDDAYDPARTVANVREMVEKDNVFALHSVNGTSPNQAIAEYVTTKQIPSLWASVGGDFIGDEHEKYPTMMAALPQYRFEAETITDWLKKEHPNAKVALLYQNDGFGKTMQADFKEAFEGTNIKMVGEQGYEVAGNSVDAEMTKLKASGADVFINFATATFATQAFKKAEDLKWKPTKIVFQGSASMSLLIPAGEGAKGTYTFGYYKDVHDPQWKDDAGMKKWMAFAKDAKEIRADDALAGAGYNYAQLMEATLKNMKGCKRQDMLDAAKSLKDVSTDLVQPSVTASGSVEYPYAYAKLQPAQFDGASWKSIGEPIERQP